MILNTNRNGFFSYCKDCLEYHIQFNNVFLTLTKEKLEKFVDYLKEINENTYSTNFLQSNNNRIMMRIRDVFREKGGEHFYSLNQLIDLINVTKQYPIDQIYSSLHSFIKNDNEYLIDKYGRRGNLKQKV